MRGLGNPHRPYTRKEWDRLRSRNGAVNLDRAEATIESGWAPDPLSEEDLRERLLVVRQPFQDEDVSEALRMARTAGVRVTVSDDRRVWTVNEHGRGDVYDCASLRVVARTIAALVFERHHEGIVDHLKGGTT